MLCETGHQRRGLLEDALISVVGDELLRVTENPYGRVPIFTLSPVRDPFKVLAELSLAEIVGEVQTIKTALMRQLLVNTVNMNNVRWFIDATGISLLQQASEQRIDYIVRVFAETEVMPMQ